MAASNEFENASNAVSRNDRFTVRMKPFGIILCLGAVLASALIPHYMFAAGADAGTVAAWGQWVSDAVIAVASILAVTQYALSRRDSETNTFLKICEIVDNEAFGASYRRVVYAYPKHSLDTLVVSLFIRRQDEAQEELRKSVIELLATFEKIGTIVEYANSNSDMILDYIGQYVVDSHYALRDFISQEKKTDKDMWQRFDELDALCISRGWKAGVERIPHEVFAPRV